MFTGRLTALVRAKTHHHAQAKESAATQRHRNTPRPERRHEEQPAGPKDWNRDRTRARNRSSRLLNTSGASSRGEQLLGFALRHQMKIRNIRTQPGPNVYSRHPVLVMKL